MNRFLIRLSDDRREWFPGEMLSGTVEWAFDEPVESLDVRLFWYTEGKGTQDVAVVESQPLLATGLEGDAPFTFRLPLEPYSVSGSLLSLVWAVECVAHPGGGTARAEFSLSHLGHELRLEAVPDEEQEQKAGLRRLFGGANQ